MKKIISIPGGFIDFSNIHCGTDLVPPIATRRAATEMLDIMRGGRVNTTEDRMVGHFWLRNAESAPLDANVAEAILAQITAVKLFSADVIANKIRGYEGTPFTDVVVVGIGGSGLGPQFLEHCFRGHVSRDKAGLRLHFIDNTDPDGCAQVIGELSNLKGTLFLMMSKSGGTREPNNGLQIIKATCESAGVPFESQAVAVTCEDSKLDVQARDEGWLKRFYLWDWVGGRTSITSVVGLLPAALFGLDIDEFLRGAREMDELTLTPGDENPAWLFATAWYHAGNGKGEKDVVFLPYKDRLALLGKYMQQLFMESLGKRKDRDGHVVNQGLTVFGNKGTTDQHAFVQQLRDGTADFTAIFLAVLDDVFSLEKVQQELPEGHLASDELLGNLLGTRAALAEVGRESASIVLNTLDMFSIGALIALFERAVGFYGGLIYVNAYDQKGVEAGKEAALEALDAQGRIIGLLEEFGALSVDDICQKDDSIDSTDALVILEHLLRTERVRVSENKGLLAKKYRLV